MASIRTRLAVPWSKHLPHSMSCGRALKIAGERLPDTFVYYTAIQKAPDKRDRWDVVETVNREMERYSHQAKNPHARPAATRSAT